MQKKIIALAVAALASSAAFAQTNVTVYGVADGSFDSVDVSNSQNSGDNIGNFTRVSANSTYIGFKGVEDLGNGLKAVFQFEQGVAMDATGGTFATRDSYVGLASGFGTVVMGNLTGPTRALGAGVDVNAGATGIGANSGMIGKIGGSRITSGANCAGSSTCTSVFDTRWANAIAYVSPTFGGFNAVAAYVADENKTRDGVNNVATARTTGFDVGANWAGAGFKVGAAYNWAQIGDIAVTETDNIRIAGGYAGSWGKVNLLWEETRLGARAQSDLKQQKWGVGAGVNLGKFEVIGQYYQAFESDGRDIKDDGAFLVEVGAVYNLSKRTSIKAIYAYLDNEKNAAFDFGINASGASAAGGTGATIQGMQIGVRHNF